MSRHAVRATVAVAALNLAVLNPPVGAQEITSAAWVEELRARAAAGEAAAQYSLGLRYALGGFFGVPQDDVEAVRWYRLAAEQGHADAQNNLGVRYANGEGVPQDYAEAVRWYRRAAEQGNADAQFNLGVMYANGRGGRPPSRATPTRSTTSGFMYGNGRGVPQDDVEAVRWYRLAAEQGHAGAQYNLGVMYANGEGVPQDYVEAVRWYRRAAEQGDAAAQYNLGVRYANGEGVPQDYVEAHMWFNLAASRSTGKVREQAVAARDRFAAWMTPADVREAQRRAREWHATHLEP